MNKLNWTALLISILIIVYLLLFFVVFSNERWSDGDEVHYLLVSSSILKDGDLALDNNYEEKDYFTHHANEEHPHAERGRNGELRPRHGILTSIILTPGYGLGLLFKNIFGFTSHRIVLLFPRLTILLLHIVFSILLIKYLQIINFIKNISILTVILYLIQLPIIIYSQAIYSDLISAYFIMAAIFLILLFSKSKKYLHLIISSIFFGMSIFLHSKLIVLTAGLILSSLWYLHTDNKENIPFKKNFSVYLHSGSSWKVFSSLTVPWFIFLLSNVMMKFYWFGSFSLDGVGGVTERSGFFPIFGNPIHGWLGQWLDIEAGLLWSAPLFTFIIIGLFIWFKKQKSIFLLIVPITFLYLAINASLYQWHAGFSPAGRYLLIAIPVCMPAMAWILEVSKKITWLRWIIGFFTLLSLTISALLPFVGRMGLPYSKGYNIYWRTILRFLRLNFLEPVISVNFLEPIISDYIIGSIMFLIPVGLGFYLKWIISKNDRIKI